MSDFWVGVGVGAFGLLAFLSAMNLLIRWLGIDEDWDEDEGVSR